MDHKKYMAMIGKKGGTNAMSKLTPEERSEKSRLATASLTPEQRRNNAIRAARISAQKRKKKVVHKST